MSDDNPSPKKSVLDSFLRPRFKEKKPQFGFYLDEDIKEASQLAEQISHPGCDPKQQNIPIKPDEKDQFPSQESTSHTFLSPTNRISADRQQDTLTGRQTDTLTGRQTVRHVDEQVDRHIDEQVDRHIDEQVDRHVDRQVVKQSDTYWMTANQANILIYLINKKNRVTRIDDIVQSTNIPYGTVRGTIRTLVKHKFITKPKYYRSGEYRGLTYSLNEIKCDQFLNVMKSQFGNQVDRQAGRQAGRQTGCQTGTFSSSSFLKVPTTKSDHNFTISVEETLATHPELGYWRQKGLTAKQVEQWMKLTGATLDNMIQSLCHCRFEMVDLDQEKTKPVENVFNWFYRVIERAGYYPAPRGYKSHLDKQIEAEKQFLAEREKKLEELRQLQQQKIGQERELAFREMLANPESELYQECLGRLNHFSKKTTNAELFEMAMRKAFDEVRAEQLQAQLEAIQAEI